MAAYKLMKYQALESHQRFSNTAQTPGTRAMLLLAATLLPASLFPGPAFVETKLTHDGNRLYSYQISSSSSVSQQVDGAIMFILSLLSLQ